MRLTILGKFPPIEGGVSSQTYWLSRSLGERGVKVSIVTNASLVEEAYREDVDLADAMTQGVFGPNVKLFSLRKPAPRHIPYSEGYVSRLVNLGLKVIGEEGSDLLFSYYLEPYGVAGFLLKKMLGLPLVLKHAGSDAFKILPHRDYAYLLGRVLTQADGVFLSPKLAALGQRLGIPRLAPPPFAIDTRYFCPEGAGFDFARFGLDQIAGTAPLIVYMGKAGPRKGILELCEALCGVREDFRLLLVSNGALRDSINGLLAADPAFARKVAWMPFIAPWEVPALLRSAALLVHLEHNFPVPIHFPQQPFEGVATGTPLLVSEEIKRKMSVRLAEATDLVTTVKDPADIPTLRNTLEQTLRNLTAVQANARTVRDAFLKQNDWNARIDAYLNAFECLAYSAREG